MGQSGSSAKAYRGGNTDAVSPAESAGSCIQNTQESGLSNNSPKLGHDKTNPQTTSSWATMEGPTYHCEYLGYSTLSKPATSIAVMQSSIKDLYLKFRKNMSSGVPSKKATFKITPGGLLVAVHEANGTAELFFEIGSVNFIEAAKFAVLQGTEKKPKAIFLPIDESRGPVSDKTAFSLDKSFHYLVQARHPPLLICVLRRPKGVKALDCHVFALDTPENAVYIAGLVQRLQQSPGGAVTDFSPPGGEGKSEGNFNRGTRGDVIRTEFGDYSVYRGPHNVELRDDHFRGGPVDVPLGSPQQSSGDPGKSRFGFSYDKPQSGAEFPRHSGQYGGDVRPPSGGGMNGAPYVSSGAQDNRYPYPVGGQPGGQYAGNRHSGVDYGGGVRAEDRTAIRGEQSYDHLQFGRQDMERSEKISHARERSGDSSDSRPSGLNISFGADSDRSGQGSNRGSFQDSRYGGPVGSPRPDMSPRFGENSQPPANRNVPAGNPVGGYSYGIGGPGPLSPRRSTESPASPLPPSPTMGPAFSMSNRESRNDGVEESQGNKPVAKVPPHLKGVKVLPTDFRAVKLKPKPQRNESEDGDSGYDNQKNIMAQYKEIQEMETQKGFHGFEEKEFQRIEQQRSYSSNWNDEHRTSGPSSPLSGGYDPDYRRYIEQYPPADAMRRNYESRYDEYPPQQTGPNRQSTPLYDGGRGLPQPSSPDWRARSMYDKGSNLGPPRSGPSGVDRGNNAPSSAANDEKQMGRKKDAEIANMFSNFRIQGPGDPYMAGERL